jgi:hypothetical protein
MGDWNKLLAQDRLDQFTLEKLQKRQEMLAQKLENAQQQPLSDAELAKEIEAIRNEQAKLAAETAQLQEKSKLVQESLAALEQTRMERLAQEAERLAAEQRGLSELDPEKMPAEIKDRLAALTKRQADLGKRVQPFAREQKGPQLAPASDAADALGKSRVPEAIAAQKEHEKRLGAWLGQLLPGGAVNKLREQVQQLAKTQRAIRADLEKLGQDLGGLNDKMIADRLSALVKKQRDLHAGVAGLPIDKKTQPLAEQKDSAAATAKTAADQLAAKDALSAFESMEKSEKQLQALAASMPQSLPVDRKEIKDAGERAKIEQIERFEKEQLLLRQETERLLADWLKSSAGAKNPLAEKLEKLAGGLMELSQKGSSPEAKSMAKESMQMIDDAKKAMELSQAMKAKGEGTEAKKLDDDAAGRLEMAFKQLDKMTQGKNPPKDGDGKTAESLEQSRAEMNKAKASLPKMPKDAQVAMKAAAKSLAEAASQASKQSKNRLPNPPARNPAARAPLAGKGANSSAILKNVKLDESIGKAWGEMPGELKTQMLQDFRARFGEDYAEMIRQYFDRLAEISAKNRQR